MLLEKEERLLFKERPLRMEAAFPLMASHWPPENLPMREVELWAGYTIVWMQHLLRAGDIPTTHSGSLPACCPLITSNPVAKSFRVFWAKFH
jgi:hypothetical protein